MKTQETVEMEVAAIKLILRQPASHTASSDPAQCSCNVITAIHSASAMIGRPMEVATEATPAGTVILWKWQPKEHLILILF